MAFLTEGVIVDDGNRVDRPAARIVGIIWMAAAAAFAAITLALVPVSAEAAPATLEVAEGGTDVGDCLTSACATIQYAVDQAALGDTIDVGPGTYAEAVKVQKEVSLRGPNAGIAAGDASRGAETIIDGGADRTVQVSSAGVSVDGFTIMGENDGVLANLADGLRIEDDIVHSSQARGIAMTNGAANVSIEGSSIEGQLYGIVASLGPYADLRIVDNSIAVPDGNPNGYALFNGGNGTFPGLDLSGNAVHGTTNIGGNIEGGAVSGNRFDAGTGELALQIDLHESTLSGNSFEGHGTGGCLQLFGTQYNLDPSADAIVAGNSFHGCDPYGIQLSAGLENIAIAANVITDSYDGINTRLVENEAPWSVDGAQIIIVGNRIVGIAHQGIDNSVEGTLEASDNWWGCNEGPSLLAGDGCAPVSAGVRAAPWLVLTGTASESVHPGESATVTAAIDTDSSGARAAVVPDGTPVAYSTDLGTLDVTAATTIGGVSTTRLTSAVAGLASVEVTVDDQTVTTPVRIEALPPAAPPPSGEHRPAPSNSPPPPPPPPPSVHIAGGGTAVQVSAAGVVRVASVACPEGSCRIAIKQRKIKVGGRGFPLRLKLDKLIDKGESTAVTAVLPPRARKALAAAGKAQAIVRLRFFSGSGIEEIPIRVRLKPPKSAR